MFNLCEARWDAPGVGGRGGGRGRLEGPWWVLLLLSLLVVVVVLVVVVIAAIMVVRVMDVVHQESAST